MTSLPDGTYGKALALAVGVLMLGAIHAALIAPLLSYHASIAQRLQERQQLVGRYQALARNLPRLRAAATQRRDQLPEAGLLLNGSTDAVAAAALQSVLKGMVESEGAKLASAEMLPAETGQNDVRRVGIRITFSGNLNVLTTVLESVETMQPVLFVGNLDVRGGGNPDQKDRRTLAIVMDIYGFHSRCEGCTT